MTDIDPPEDPLDELASAIVDGEATDEELARAGEPEVAARVAAFRSVARQVGAPVPPPPGDDRDRAIAAALAAAPGPPVRSVTEQRARRRLPTWAVQAAAALVVIAGLGVLAAAIGGDGDDDGGDAAETASAGSAADTTVGADDGAGDASGGSGGAAGEDTGYSAPAAASAALGSFPDPESLADAGRALASDFTTAQRDQAPPSEELAAACEVPADAVVFGGDVDGSPALVVVDHAEARVQVVDVSSCAVLLDEPL